LQAQAHHAAVVGRLVRCGVLKAFDEHQVSAS